MPSAPLGGAKRGVGPVYTYTTPFSEEKLRILQEADACEQERARRGPAQHGIHSSHLVSWRDQPDDVALRARRLHTARQDCAASLKRRPRACPPRGRRWRRSQRREPRLMMREMVAHSIDRAALACRRRLGRSFGQRQIRQPRRDTRGKIGMPDGSATPNWIMGGTLGDGSAAVTRAAPGLGTKCWRRNTGCRCTWRRD